MLGAGPPGDRFQDVDGRGQADAIIDVEGRVLNEVVAGMQYEAASGIHRAALHHLHGLGMLRQLDLVGLFDDVELHQQFREVDAARRPVDDDAHRAFRGMRTHVDDGTLETGIAHDRHGDQDATIEIAALGRIIADAGGLAASGPGRFAFRTHPRGPSCLNPHPDIGWRACQSRLALQAHHLTRNSMVYVPANL